MAMPLDARTQSLSAYFSAAKSGLQLRRCVAGLALACVAAAPPPTPPADAGGVAAERGWFGLARDCWREASEAATGEKRPEVQRHMADQGARLEALVQETRHRAAAREAEAGHAWAASTWTQRWQTQTGSEPCHSACFSRITIGGGLVFWNTDRAAHAVTLATGKPPWQATATDHNTTVFPRGAAARKGIQTGQPPFHPSAPELVGGRGYAVLTFEGNRQRLVCLDLSAAAQGRLVWAVDAATILLNPLAGSRPAASAEGVRFDGQPAADHELCVVVMQADRVRGGLLLAAFDARDGSLRWLRPAGPSLAVDGLDHARGHRRACLAQDRILLATHAGTIQGFDRTGTLVWATASPAFSKAVAADSSTIRSIPAPPAFFAFDRVLVAPRDMTGVVALDPRRGGILWRWTDDDDVADVLGPAGDGLVIATQSRDGTAVLRRLSIVDGRETARSGDTDTAVHAAGPGTIADGTVFWPVGSQPLGQAVPGPDALLLEVLDTATLVRRRKPLACSRPELRSDDSRDAVFVAVADGSLVLTVSGMMTCWRPSLAAPQ